MPLLLVTYKVTSDTTDRSVLIEQIKRGATGWWHYIDDVWIVSTEQTAENFAKSLYQYVTPSDRLFVTGITGEHQGLLPADAWSWLRETERTASYHGSG